MTSHKSCVWLLSCFRVTECLTRAFSCCANHFRLFFRTFSPRSFFAFVILTLKFVCFVSCFSRNRTFGYCFSFTLSICCCQHFVNSRSILFLKWANTSSENLLFYLSGFIRTLKLITSGLSVSTFRISSRVVYFIRTSISELLFVLPCGLFIIQFSLFWYCYFWNLFCLLFYEQWFTTLWLEFLLVFFRIQMFVSHASLQKRHQPKSLSSLFWSFICQSFQIVFLVSHSLVCRSFTEVLYRQMLWLVLFSAFP